ncbi:ACP phosphodiesterase [Mucilaginibacter sp.]
MNFLSHFYFDRNVTNCYHILGIVLPDLLKNADKTIVLHPEKLHDTNADINCIIKGWNKHLEVDRYFHSSEFFLTHSHELKKLLTPAIAGSPVKPFFLGHIALELILDNLLITTNKLDAHDFYEHMNGCDHEIIQEFLTFAGLNDSTKFFRFFDGFKRDGYLHTYSETPKIAYALKRICMRVWEDPFIDEHEAAINDVVVEYREQIYDDFMQIFDEIDVKLSLN